MCVKDCGLHNKNIDMKILLACLVGWIDSSPVEIQKNLGTIFKNLLGLAWLTIRPMHGPMHMYLRGPQSLAHCSMIQKEAFSKDHKFKKKFSIS